MDDLVKEILFDSRTGEIVSVGVSACEEYLRLESRVGRSLSFVDCSEFTKDEWTLMKESTGYRMGYGAALRHLRKTGMV